MLVLSLDINDGNLVFWIVSEIAPSLNSKLRSSAYHKGAQGFPGGLLISSTNARQWFIVDPFKNTDSYSP